MPLTPSALRHRLVAVLLALFAAGTSLLISSAVLDRIPHVTDGVSYAFQGKIFASGRLFLDPPPAPALFVHENVVLDAVPDAKRRWCSLYPPGWPLLLALGWLIGAPWIVDPLLLGLSVIGIWRLGRSLFDPTTGLLAAVALAVSPFALILSAGFLAHGPALCAGVWCLAFLVEGAEGAEEGSRRRFALAGLLGGFMFLIRPFTALAVLGPAVLWGLFRLRRDRRWISAMGWMALGALPCALAFLLYNRAVFGGALTTGYQAYDAARFGSVGGMAVAPAEAFARNLPWYLSNLNRCLWGLPWPDLLIFLPLLWPRPGRGRDAMLASCAACLVLGHCFYYYRDVIYSGPRFAFEALGPLSILAARSLLTVNAGLAALLQRARPESRRLLRLAVIGSGSAILLFFPLGRRLPAQMVRHSQWYLAVSGEPLRRMAEAGVGREALVFVSGTPWCYSALFLANDFPLKAGRVFVRDIPPLRQAALRAYPRPEVWQARMVVDIPDPENAPDIAKPVEVSWTRLR